ncbi:MAG: hypothetical protein COA73_15390 [Candidatus Hydrogenedentota bacterium]|nr:MAG: hypothetical protein COA73_15390 [Candidatus Hydrogenedentota bacterium]
MAVVSRYIAGLCVIIAVSAAYSQETESATLSFSGKGNGPIQVTDDSGTTNAVISRPIAVVRPSIPKLQHAGTEPDSPKIPVTKTARDESIDEMLKTRPKRDPRRMNTEVSPVPPQARKR